MKIKNIYICQGCRFESVKWIGKCPECLEWNSFEEECVQKNKSSLVKKVLMPKLLSEINIKNYNRFETNISELDRVLGGGVVLGSLNLIGGEPGIGKSTLLIQLLNNLANLYGENVLYISGEESEQQIAKRAQRLSIDSKKMYIYYSTSWEEIIQKIDLIKPKFLIIDSIQTTISSEIGSAAGSITQVREITYEIMNLVKSRNISTFLISHINKSGNIAGPKVLEHMVDTVLYFEGDQYGQYRILRGIKNRYGSNNEVGLFEMTEHGLKEVVNPSCLFLNNLDENISGKTISCIIEGCRPIFVEIQALVVENKQGNCRRTTQGIDPNRISMLVAIIEKYFKINLSQNDLYINIIGGMNIKSKDCDLAIISAIISSYLNKPIAREYVLFGELGLTGEIRKIIKLEKRVYEAKKLGFKQVITGKINLNEIVKKNSIKILGFKTTNELLSYLF